MPVPRSRKDFPKIKPLGVQPEERAKLARVQQIGRIGRCPIYRRSISSIHNSQLRSAIRGRGNTKTLHRSRISGRSRRNKGEFAEPCSLHIGRFWRASRNTPYKGGETVIAFMIREAWKSHAS